LVTIIHEEQTTDGNTVYSPTKTVVHEGQNSEGNLISAVDKPTPEKSKAV